LRRKFLARRKKCVKIFECKKNKKKNQNEIQKCMSKKKKEDKYGVERDLESFLRGKALVLYWYFCVYVLASQPNRNFNYTP
jgi:hypothetical protein